MSRHGFDGPFYLIENNFPSMCDWHSRWMTQQLEIDRNNYWVGR
nr:hypothetical protein Q903MT_gene3374 [Picea sitchensis]